MLPISYFMRIHVDALFRQDERGRLLSVNDIDRGTAPRVYLGRSAEGNIWRLRHDLAPELAGELEAILAEEPVTADPEVPADTVRRLKDALGRDAPVESIWEGPAWHFPTDITVPPGVEVQQVIPGMKFAGEQFRWLADELEYCQPAFVVLDGDQIASLCHSSRNTAVAAEAGVETVEAYRGRGYATAVVAAWAREVRAQGREPLYSTSWDNNASRALARRLGLELYGADLHLT